MKNLLYIFLFISFPCLAQKTPGYFSIRGGAAFLEDAPKGIGHISFGLSPNRTIGIGAGIGFVHIDKLYVPSTVDISYFGKPGKVSPIIIGSAGYGLYNEKNAYFTTKGGFTGSLNAGIAIPAKKANKFYLTGGYALYGFSGGSNIQTSGTSYKVKDNLKVWIITIGVKI
jgi:hypothetical protein